MSRRRRVVWLMVRRLRARQNFRRAMTPCGVTQREAPEQAALHRPVPVLAPTPEAARAGVPSRKAAVAHWREAAHRAVSWDRRCRRSQALPARPQAVSLEPPPALLARLP